MYLKPDIILPYWAYPGNETQYTLLIAFPCTWYLHIRMIWYDDMVLLSVPTSHIPRYLYCNF